MFQCCKLEEYLGSFGKAEDFPYVEPNISNKLSENRNRILRKPSSPSLVILGQKLVLTQGCCTGKPGYQIKLDASEGHLDPDVMSLRIQDRLGQHTSCPWEDGGVSAYTEGSSRVLPFPLDGKLVIQ